LAIEPAGEQGAEAKSQVNPRLSEITRLILQSDEFAGGSLLATPFSGPFLAGSESLWVNGYHFVAKLRSNLLLESEIEEVLAKS
jgi:hypothetical protein